VGQTEVIVEAMSAADVDPATIGYVEAHGTGTHLGDPVEVSALTKAFRTRTDAKGFCALGSVKTNVGHLDAAAGAAGLIKVVLSLQHGQIPPSLHFQTANPEIDFASSPFFMNTSLRDWPLRGGPRRAGVSAFGVGGTNAHLILEEAPAVEKAPAPRTPQLVVLSAKTPGALEEMTERLAAHLDANPQLELADVAYTLQVGRRSFAHRRAVVASDLAEAVAGLRAPGGPPTAVCERRNPPAVLVLSAEGPLLVDTWRSLYDGAPAFREGARRCAEAAGRAGTRMLEALYPSPAPNSSLFLAEDLEPLALFAVEFGLARLWATWGLRFEAVVGEGVGKLVAASLDGTIDLASGLGLAARVHAASSPEGEGRRSEDREPTSPPMRLPEDGHRLYLELTGARVTLRTGTAGAGTPCSSPPMGGGTAGWTQLLELLAGLWLSGVDVGWPAVHAPESRRRIPLPTYPFQRRRFWVDPIEDSRPNADGESGATSLFRPVWKTALPVVRRGPRPARSLLFADSMGLGARLAEGLRAAGSEVVTVKVGRVFSGDPAIGYTLDPAEPRHYDALWQELRRHEKLPERAIHLWSVESPVTAVGVACFQQECEKGFYSLLHLAATRPEGRLAVQVVSAGLHEVIGGELLCPEKAPLLALCRVLAQEEHELTCGSVDLEDPIEGFDEIASQLLAELVLVTPEPLVAYRRGRRWRLDYEPILPPAGGGDGSVEPLGPSSVREGGVYLVTGGLGDVGFTLASSLARRRAKLVLASRTELPPRERWEHWLAANDSGEPTSLRVRRVQALEALGAEVLVLQADAADVAQMRAVVKAAEDRFGPLHGVIYAAGEMAADTFRPVRELERAVCERQFTPKVRGLLALDEALGGRYLDFCLLCSSLSAVLGGVGYAAYAGANAFMDAFAVRRGQEGRAWISVNWDQWEFKGRRRLAPGAPTGPRLGVEQGRLAFERVLCLRGVDRVLVSAGPLASRLERWVRLAPSARPGEETGGARPRPSPGTTYVDPRNESEQALAAIWQELLGVERVGMHDNFFELGGHSLFAARVLSRLRQVFGVSLSLDALFDAPTIAELTLRVTAAVRARQGGGGDDRETAGQRMEIEI
jgi:acyl transferase domain-containing protein